jgi:hypothetical protein
MLPLPGNPFPGLSKSGIHRVGRKIEPIRPRHRTELDGNLREYRSIGKRGEDARIRRVDKTGHVYRTLRAIEETHMQAKAALRANLRHVVRMIA